MAKRSHTDNDDSSKIDISFYTQQIDHLKRMLELKTDISRLREERIWKLEDELKNLTREKFVFVN
jgi:hypothetical protein